MKNGALVLALGSSLGANHSVIAGNITSVENEVMTKDRNYSVYTTNIVANTSSSGVLINTKGEVIGFVMQDFVGNSNISALTAVSIGEIDEMIQNLKNGKIFHMWDCISLQ